MRTRIVHTQFWEDDYILNLSVRERLLFIFLLTNSRCGQTCYYEISPIIIKTSTGLSDKELYEIKCKFQNDKKFIFYQSWVYVVNAEKYQTYSGSKNELAYEKELRLIPQHIKDFFESGEYPMDSVSIDYAYPRHTTINHKSINHKSETNKSENKKEETCSWKQEYGTRYIEAFNKLFSSNFILTPKRTQKLKERFKTFTKEQIAQALINLSKSKFHQGENDRNWKADPDFLIRNDEMVDKWLNAKGGVDNG